MKPLNVRRASASVPPQTAASNWPSAIASAAWPIAIVLEEQADTMQARRPVKSNFDAITSTGMFE